MKNATGFFVFVIIIALGIGLAVSRSPVQSIAVVKEAPEQFEPSDEYRAATYRKPVVTYRDGDWVEIVGESGELNFVLDRAHGDPVVAKGQKP